MKKVWCAFKDIIMIICVIFIGLLILLLALISGGINWVWMKCTKKDEVLIPFGNWVENLFGLNEYPYIYEEDNYNDL